MHWPTKKKKISKIHAWKDSVSQPFWFQNSHFIFILGTSGGHSMAVLSGGFCQVWTTTNSFRQRGPSILQTNTSRFCLCATKFKLLEFNLVQRLMIHLKTRNSEKLRLKVLPPKSVSPSHMKFDRRRLPQGGVTPKVWKCLSWGTIKWNLKKEPQMSVFAFHLRSCLRYSEHEGSVCRQKGQRRANGEKKKTAQTGAYWFVFLYLGHTTQQRKKANMEAICRLHFLRDVNSFRLDKICDILVH